MEFVAIDVETSNPSLSSICQVGVAIYKNGQIQKSWESIVDPDDYFDPINISIHGIDERAVHNAPKWNDIHQVLGAMLHGKIVVSHSSFDRMATIRASEVYNVQPYECSWLDTVRVARRAWPEFSRSGYGLANIAQHLEIEFRHHNALEDARVCGEILNRAISDTGISLEDWLTRINQPITPKYKVAITRDANTDGPLYGEKIVFTGALAMPRREAADVAAIAGCEVESGVTKHTTILVVGDQDISRLSGNEKSSKHRKAEDLIAKGQKITIIGESDFRRITTM